MLQTIVVDPYDGFGGQAEAVAMLQTRLERGQRAVIVVWHWKEREALLKRWKLDPKLVYVSRPDRCAKPLRSVNSVIH